MSKNTCTAINAPAYLECQICFDSWLNPVQLNSCGHIFCAHCITRNMTKCFLCGSAITGTHIPSDHICNAADNVQVVCSSCGWRGSRKASQSHRCNSKETHSLYSAYPEKTDKQWIEFIKGVTITVPTVTTMETVRTVVRDENGNNNDNNNIDEEEEKNENDECKRQRVVCDGIVL